MSSEKDYCTILDKLYDIKDHNEFVLQLHKLCLTSLLASNMGRRTLILPPKSVVKKIEKMKHDDAKMLIRRHILNKQINAESFKKGDTLNVGTMVKNNRYNVKQGSKHEIVVDGVSCKFLKDASNGSIYQADAELQEHITTEGVEGAERGSRRNSRSKSRSKTPKSKRRRRTQHGGGNYFPLVQNNFKHEYDGSVESRLLFIQQYEDQFKKMWPHYALGHLLLYLNENVGDLKNQFIPFLGSNPTTSLELLLGLYQKPEDASRLLINNQMFSGFANSPYFLSSNQALMIEARELLESIYNIHGLGSCAYDSPSVDLNFISSSQGILSNILKTNPLALGESVMNIYKIMTGEPNRFNPGHMRVFEKVWQEPVMGLIKNDLIRFTGNMYDMSIPYEQRYSQMSSMFQGNARDVINRIINNDILKTFTTNPSTNYLNMPLGGLGQSTDYENLLKYMGMWVNSTDFAHSFQIDLAKNGGVDNLLGFGSGYLGVPNMSNYNLTNPTTSLNMFSQTHSGFGNNSGLFGLSSNTSFTLPAANLSSLTSL
jgi:hypothetical protein